MAQHSSTPFPLVIVGSGYGAAMAAAVLAGCTDEGGKPVRICVLERGLEFREYVAAYTNASAIIDERFQ